ncbi:MAG: sulfatase-like hydrolase/transferase [Anaeromyxobacter sp.]
MKNAAPTTRAPSLFWALLHAPVVFALYLPQVLAAVRAAPGPYQAALWPTFAVQAVVVAVVPWLATLPLSPWPRLHRVAAPVATALGLALAVLDSQVQRTVGFHLNGFILTVLGQPTGLSEVGLTRGAALAISGGLLALAAVDAAIGVRYLGRCQVTRRVLPAVAALLLLGFTERVYGQVLAYRGGPALFAAGGVLPLQVPVRMGKLLGRVLGQRDVPGTLAAYRPGGALPPGLAPGEVRFTRTPDVLFVLAESLPHDHLDAATMPHLWDRAAHGARFTRHYASAPATAFAVFSTFYGLQAQKLEATVGAGRRPLVFDAFRANGYDVHALAASCVDWMDLRQTVFGGLSSGLETWCDAPGLGRDLEMVARARAIAAETPRDRPLFLFLFFNATHFTYPRADEDVAFLPEWDGSGGFKSTTADPAAIRNRARNAARTVDRLLDGLLDDLARARGAAPLLVFTGDHGEEFRQKGHLGHGSDVDDEQIHVPLVVTGPGVPAGVFTAPTSHVDLVPTLLALLGDRHPPARYADGIDAFTATPERFVVSTVGWEPRHAAIGADLKVRTWAGSPAADYTDLDDRPLPDGAARAAAHAGAILKAMRGGGDSQVKN